MCDFIWLILLGLAVGICGTIIGVGGGFILMPVLLLIYPDASPALLTAISLAVICLNSLSGSWAYARLGRIDFKSGLFFAACAIPGAVLGALTTSFLPRRLFNGIFGLLMIGVAAFLMARPPAAGSDPEQSIWCSFARRIVERDGTAHTFAYNPWLGGGLSLLVGCFSNLMGVGGGIMHVPVMTCLLNFPAHLATATSQFILVPTSLAGVLVHVSTGVFAGGWQQALFLALGVIPGAQIGARLAGRIHAVWLIRALAVALGIVGLRILFTAL